MAWTWFFLQLAVIFIPGMIWERIDTQFAQKRALAQFDVLRRTFTFGLTAYLLTYVAYLALGRNFDLISPSKDGTFINSQFADEILAASATGFLSSIAWLYSTNYKLITRLMQAIRATKRYGDEDVWDFTFNSRQAAVEYVHLRDFEKKIIYAGWVEVFSETDKVRELVLRDVIVYDFEGNTLFETPRVYVARAMDKIDIEFPYARGSTGDET